MTPDEFTSADAPPVALITGAARRLGAAFARALAHDGWSIILHCHSSTGPAETLARELAAQTGRPMAVVVQDLAASDAGSALFAQCPRAPTLLINNASGFTEDSLHDFTATGWDAHLDVNLRAPALLTQGFARQLPPDSRGLIVNLLDAKLSAPNSDFFSYTISKYGLAGLTELSARALAPLIRVNAIAPAVTLVSGPQTREEFEAVHSLNALRQGVEVEHLVAALRYIVRTPTVTGQTLTVDGGQRFLALPRDVAYMAPL
ncbi:MAG: SDR family NAD(P)-dependent oxidoreductase [Sphingomonadaceae bacterium]